MNDGWEILEVRGVKDLDYMGRVGAHFYAEGNLPGRCVPEVFAKTWMNLREMGLGTIWMLLRDGEIVGALGGVVTADPNDGVLTGSEMFWWVQPECRGHGLRLLMQFEEWARGRGAKRLAMVHLLSLMPEKVGKLYERMGYTAVEVNYHKQL